MRFLKLPAIVLSGFGCAACVSLETIRADAESVFREHNRIASDVMLVLAERDPQEPSTAALAELDRRMLVACEPLNEAAIAHREGQRPTLRERLALPAAIDKCRAATAQAALALSGNDDRQEMASPDTNR